MRNLMLKTPMMAAMVFTVLTTVQPVLAQDGSTSRTTIDQEEGPTRLSDLGTHINPQVGVSSFEYSRKGGSASKFSGGATAEFGEGMRRLETGLLLVQAGGSALLSDGSTKEVNSSYLAIPMMAKIRVMQMASQSWFIKAGALTAFEVGSNSNGTTNNVDVLASLGLGGRFAFSKSADFIVEATYNRGLIDAVRTSSSSNTDYNQGVLALVGMSFRL